MAEGGDSLSGLQLKLAAMTAERNELFDWTTDTFEKLKAAKANLALQSALWEAAREELSTHTAEIVELQEQLTARGSELSQLSASIMGRPMNLVV